MGNWDILRIIWFFLIAILFYAYSILDGFDLGIGTILKFFAKDNNEKKILFKSIGPVWDGNEVWLLTAGGALFASFPPVYATVFSGFYSALMIVIFALIFRAVSFEFWHYTDKGKNFWEWAFVLGSFIPSLLFGVALGNILIGIPLDENFNFTGNFFTLLRPFPLMIGLLGLNTILLQGAAYILLKSKNDIHQRARKWFSFFNYSFVILFIISLLFSFIYLSKEMEKILPWVFSIFILLCWFSVSYYFKKEKEGYLFLFTSLIFLGLWGIVCSIMFPDLVKSSSNSNMNIFNSSSSELTLTVMLIIALIGMPLVIYYTYYIYKTFKGKVTADS